LTQVLEAFMNAMVGDEAASVEEAGQLLIKCLRPTSLLGRLATTDEVANLIVYLCSASASATTGASVRVNGGVIRTVA
jgi:NAD(P)-dependent dehydrogenase (short-subunit alcohol dehydrogenase family)